MKRRGPGPVQVDEPSDNRRSAVERQLLSLLAGFQRLHRLGQAEMCEVLIDCTDWIACPNYASRVSLVDDALVDDALVDDAGGAA